MERRDRLCVQEDIEIRARALTAEKALRLALERLRILESERRVWLRTRDAPKEVNVFSTRVPILHLYTHMSLTKSVYHRW